MDEPLTRTRGCRCLGAGPVADGSGNGGGSKDGRNALVELDVNKDGKINKEEPKVNAVIAAYFDPLDTHKDGFLHDLKPILRTPDTGFTCIVFPDWKEAKIVGLN